MKLISKWLTFRRLILKGLTFKGPIFTGLIFKMLNFMEPTFKWLIFKEPTFKGLTLSDLEKVNLQGANLKGTHHLLVDQLSKVKTLYNAKLDEELLIQLQEKYPALFEEPD